jgi:hypothetical protein
MRRVDEVRRVGSSFRDARKALFPGAGMRTAHRAAGKGSPRRAGDNFRVRAAGRDWDGAMANESFGHDMPCCAACCTSINKPGLIKRESCLSS